MLCENTEEGRRKFREDLNETHHLFKDFVHRMRPGLDIEQVATGEHWYGVQALEKGLVDAVETSDELLLGLMESHEVIGVRYQQRKKMLDRFTGSAAETADVNNITRGLGLALLFSLVLIDQVVLVRQLVSKILKHVKYRCTLRRR